MIIAISNFLTRLSIGCTRTVNVYRNKHEDKWKHHSMTIITMKKTPKSQIDQAIFMNDSQT